MNYSKKFFDWTDCHFLYVDLNMDFAWTLLQGKPAENNFEELIRIWFTPENFS